MTVETTKVPRSRILYFSYPLDDKGAPHQAMGALWLARQGVFVRFLGWGNKAQPAWLEDYPTISYQLLPKKGLLTAFRVLFSWFQEFFHEKPDFVYVQGAQQIPFLLWLPLLKGTVRIIYHTQDYLGPGQHWFYETCERFFARRADWVIGNEPNRARFMASSYRLKRVPEVIRSALPSWWHAHKRDADYRQELLEQSGLTEIDNPRLIVAGGGYDVGRMSPELIAAFSQLPDNYILIFTGMTPRTSSYKDCEICLRSVGVSKRVVVLQRLQYSELLKLYTACDIGILLYPNSGIGHFYQAPGRLTEYLRCGLQVVAANFPGLELLVLKYQLGMVADPYDAESIAAAIRRLGEQSDEESARLRDHVKTIAMSQLVYETQAEPVLKRFTTPVRGDVVTKP